MSGNANRGQGTGRAPLISCDPSEWVALLGPRARKEYKSGQKLVDKISRYEKEILGALGTIDDLYEELTSISEAKSRSIAGRLHLFKSMNRYFETAGLPSRVRRDAWDEVLYAHEQDGECYSISSRDYQSGLRDCVDRLREIMLKHPSEQKAKAKVFKFRDPDIFPLADNLLSALSSFQAFAGKLAGVATAAGMSDDTRFQDLSNIFNKTIETLQALRVYLQVDSELDRIEVCPVKDELVLWARLREAVSHLQSRPRSEQVQESVSKLRFFVADKTQQTLRSFQEAQPNNVTPISTSGRRDSRERQDLPNPAPVGVSPAETGEPREDDHKEEANLGKHLGELVGLGFPDLVILEIYERFDPRFVASAKREFLVYGFPEEEFFQIVLDHPDLLDCRSPNEFGNVLGKLLKGIQENSAVVAPDAKGELSARKLDKQEMLALTFNRLTEILEGVSNERFPAEVLAVILLGGFYSGGRLFRGRLCLPPQHVKTNTLRCVRALGSYESLYILVSQKFETFLAYLARDNGPVVGWDPYALRINWPKQGEKSGFKVALELVFSFYGQNNR